MPEPDAYGLVWQSVVDPKRVNTRRPRPTFDGGPISVRIDSIVLISADGTSQNSASCAASIESFQVESDTCLGVQYRYDVGTDLAVDQNSQDGSIIAGAAITPDGLQLDSGLADAAFPGTRDNIFVALYAGGVPGSTIRFRTGNNLAQYVDHELVVPPREQLKPIYED